MLNFLSINQIMTRLLEQARPGGTHRPELTIFWAFYFIMEEQNMEEEEGKY